MTQTTRQAILESLRANPVFSVLIIGGGVNGIGTFRDLALQGVDVLLVDRADFCAGASAASSHMVHGGIRYLENGEFRLVREAVHERNRLLQNAPHYVQPLATTIPSFKWFSGILNAPLKFLGLLDRPAERGALIIKAGLMLYDVYTAKQGTVPPHRFESRAKSLMRFPKLHPDIVATATYYDAAMHAPERICLEMVFDAERTARDGGSRAHAVNYMRAAFTTGDAVGDTVILHDEITGETVAVQPRVVINAAGPWIDFANRALNRPTHFIGGTKGSHLVLDHAELRATIGETEFFFENKDGRIVLIYPLLDKILVGTSDIRIDDPDEARCTDEEIDYFLEMIARIFPSIQVDRSHIVFTFSGVRPLPSSDANATGQISRDHSIQAVKAGEGVAFPVLSLVGGKWTTFRAFAAKVTDDVLARLGLIRKCDTKELAIGGGNAYPHTISAQKQWMARLHEQTGLPEQRIETLFQRYGTRAADVAEFIAAGEDRPLQHQPEYSQREVLFLTQHEKVVHLDDLILRRSLLGMLGQVTSDLADELADIVGEGLGWSPDQRAHEVERLRTLLAEKHRVTLAPDGSVM